MNPHNSVGWKILSAGLDSGLTSLKDNTQIPCSNSYDSPFDFIAADYDHIFSGSCIGRAQRAAVWEETDRLFKPGQSVLELNCGTGVDAIHLAGCGVSVFGFDQSSRMLSLARNRVVEAGCERQVHLHQMAIEDMFQWDTSLQFDGAFSNFGGLNCVANLSEFALDLARLVKPGGPVVLCMLSRSCLWEWVYFLGRIDLGKAIRRFHKGGTTAQIKHRTTFRVYYPGVRKLKRCMDPYFHYVWHKAVGLTVPPTYLENWVEHHPRVLRISRSLDNIMSHWPVFRNLGDHFLALFIRR